MTIRALDHVNVRTAHLAAMTAFYRDVLGMAVGPRPAFSFGGAWMYCGERPVVHLVEVATQPEPAGGLRLEHFALAGDDIEALLASLSGAGVPHRLSDVADFGLRQVHFADPDGNHIHVDFRIPRKEPTP